MSKKHFGHIDDQELLIRGRGAVNRSENAYSSPWHPSEALNTSNTRTSIDAWTRDGLRFVRKHPTTVVLGACVVGTLIGFASGFLTKALLASNAER